MISEVIREVQDRVDQFVGIILIGTDGFPIDSIIKEGSNFETIVIEHIAIIKKVILSMEAMEIGHPVELVIIGDRMSLIFSSITGNYFLAMGVGPKSNIGKARYELKRAVMPLKKELET